MVLSQILLTTFFVEDSHSLAHETESITTAIAPCFVSCLALSIRPDIVHKVVVDIFIYTFSFFSYRGCSLLIKLVFPVTHHSYRSSQQWCLGYDRIEVLRNRIFIAWFRFFSTGTGISKSPFRFLLTGTGILKCQSGWIPAKTGIPVLNLVPVVP